MSSKIQGKVESVDASGKLISDISNAQLDGAPRDNTLLVRFGEHETQGLFPPDHGQPDATMVASLGASGYIEIEIVGISLSDMLGIHAGEPVTIQW